MNTQHTMSREEKADALSCIVITMNLQAAHECGSGYLRLPLRTLEQAKAERADKVAS